MSACAPVVALLLALAASSPAANRAAAPPSPSKPAPSGPAARSFEWLRPGAYELEVQGMLCTACAGAIVEALGSVGGVENAMVDFDRRALRIVVGSRQSLHVNMVKRALNRASRRIDLGGRLTLGKIRYIP